MILGRGHMNMNSVALGAKADATEWSMLTVNPRDYEDAFAREVARLGLFVFLFDL